MYCAKCDRHWGRFSLCPKEHGGCNGKLLPSFKTIITVEAREMPIEVEDWCIDHEYSTHHDNSIAQVYNNNNPFANWLKKNGYKFKAKFSEEDYGEFDEIGIIAT